MGKNKNSKSRGGFSAAAPKPSLDDEPKFIELSDEEELEDLDAIIVEEVKKDGKHFISIQRKMT